MLFSLHGSGGCRTNTEKKRAVTAAQWNVILTPHKSLPPKHGARRLFTFTFALHWCQGFFVWVIYSFHFRADNERAEKNSHSILSLYSYWGGWKDEEKILSHLRMKEKSIWCWKMSSFSSSMLTALCCVLSQNSLLSTPRLETIRPSFCVVEDLASMPSGSGRAALFPTKRKSFCKHKTLILGNLWTFWYCVPSAYAPLTSRSDTTSSCLTSSCLPREIWACETMPIPSLLLLCSCLV